MNSTKADSWLGSDTPRPPRAILDEIAATKIEAYEQRRETETARWAAAFLSDGGCPVPAEIRCLADREIVDPA